MRIVVGLLTQATTVAEYTYEVEHGTSIRPLWAADDTRHDGSAVVGVR